HVPGPRGVFHECDLVSTRADQRGDGRVKVVDLARRLRRRLVSANGCFPLEMLGDRVHDWAWWQRRARIVEVENLGDAGRVRAEEGDVEGHEIEASPRTRR